MIHWLLRKDELCFSEEQCRFHVFRCKACSFECEYEIDECPECGAGWKSLDVQHGPECPRTQLEESMQSPFGCLIDRACRFLNAKGLGITYTFADITEEEYRVMELIESERPRPTTAASPSHG